MVLLIDFSSCLVFPHLFLPPSLLPPTSFPLPNSHPVRYCYTGGKRGGRGGRGEGERRGSGDGVGIERDRNLDKHDLMTRPDSGVPQLACLRHDKLSRSHYCN